MARPFFGPHLDLAVFQGNQTSGNDYSIAWVTYFEKEPCEDLTAALLKNRIERRSLRMAPFRLRLTSWLASEHGKAPVGIQLAALRKSRPSHEAEAVQAP